MNQLNTPRNDSMAEGSIELKMVKKPDQLTVYDRFIFVAQTKTNNLYVYDNLKLVQTVATEPILSVCCDDVTGDVYVLTINQARVRVQKYERVDNRYYRVGKIGWIKQICNAPQSIAVCQSKIYIGGYRTIVVCPLVQDNGGNFINRSPRETIEITNGGIADLFSIGGVIFAATDDPLHVYKITPMEERSANCCQSISSAAAIRQKRLVSISASSEEGGYYIVVDRQILNMTESNIEQPVHYTPAEWGSLWALTNIEKSKYVLGVSRHGVNMLMIVTADELVGNKKISIGDQDHDSKGPHTEDYLRGSRSAGGTRNESKGHGSEDYRGSRPADASTGGTRNESSSRRSEDSRESRPADVSTGGTRNESSSRRSEDSRESRPADVSTGGTRNESSSRRSEDSRESRPADVSTGGTRNESSSRRSEESRESRPADVSTGGTRNESKSRRSKGRERKRRGDTQKQSNTGIDGTGQVNERLKLDFSPDILVASKGYLIACTGKSCYVYRKRQIKQELKMPRLISDVCSDEDSGDIYALLETGVSLMDLIVQKSRVQVNCFTFRRELDRYQNAGVCTFVMNIDVASTLNTIAVRGDVMCIAGISTVHVFRVIPGRYFSNTSTGPMYSLRFRVFALFSSVHIETSKSAHILSHANDLLTFENIDDFRRSKLKNEYDLDRFGSHLRIGHFGKRKAVVTAQKPDGKTDIILLSNVGDHRTSSKIVGSIRGVKISAVVKLDDATIALGCSDIASGNGYVLFVEIPEHMRP
ncbi:uncharacterized protein LOC141903748 [Tubulanus polymorphus]|uniref:uncharacterized protein LOC141903748 n=1 Tax=Tubulanus polymorphus TaxID=672921 RepID=UPI003DA69132